MILPHKMEIMRAASSASTINSDSTTPYIDGFIEAWKNYLTQNNKTEFLIQLTNENALDELEYEDYVDMGFEFTKTYALNILSEKDQDKLFQEYGMKRLIDLKCKYDDDEICEELLDFTGETKRDWCNMLLLNVIKIFT